MILNIPVKRTNIVLSHIQGIAVIIKQIATILS